jgi:P27 family predicted phage terminase small subunit
MAKGKSPVKGRKPTPKPILKIRGSKIRERHRKSLTVPPGSAPSPAWLCDIGRAEWDRVSPMLEASKVMSPRYQQSLAAYCDSFADMVKADEELRANGATFMDDKGRISNHPAWNRKRDARASMLRFAAEFGLTASAASRVAASDEKPEEDEASRILFG